MKKNKPLLVVLRYLMLVFFTMLLIFAGLQYNDPDPELWIPLYLIPAAICLLAFTGRFYNYLTFFLILGYMSGSIYIWPNEYMGITFSMDYHPSVEEARESLGLLIASISMLSCMAFAWFSYPKRPASPLKEKIINQMLKAKG
jgi:hypothetical protein